MSDCQHDGFAAAHAVAFGKVVLLGVIIVALGAGGWFWNQRQAEDLVKVHGERTKGAAMSEMNAQAAARLHNNYGKTPKGALNIPIGRAMEIIAKELK